MKELQLKILKLLIEEPEQEFSINRIARIQKKPYAHVYNLTKELVKKNVLKLKLVPPAHIVQFHPKVPLSIITGIEQARTEEFLEKHPWISVYKKSVVETSPNPFFVLLVFGSYAKKKQTPKSDLDLLLIVPEKEDIQRFEPATKHYTKVRKSILVIDVQSFFDMIRNTVEFNVGNEARKHHIILHNIETYYHLIERAYQ